MGFFSGNRYVFKETFIDENYVSVFWFENNLKNTKEKLLFSNYLLLNIFLFFLKQLQIRHFFFILCLSLLLNGTYVHYLYLQEIYETCILNQVQTWFFFVGEKKSANHTQLQW
jgi:hypothetical protein